jgi:hypothetical protein
MICLLAGLGACGGNSVHHLADSSIDALMPDAETFDGPIPGMVSVVVTLQGIPTANVPVYFQDADSTLIGSAEVLTDDTGTASAVMNDGGFATVIEPQALSVTNASAQVLVTFSGVKQGDVLHDDVDPVATTTTAKVEMTAPVDHNVATDTYTLLTTCPDSSTTLSNDSVGSNLAGTSVNLADCSVGDMVVETFNANDAPVDFLFDANVAVSNGSSIVLTGTYVPVVDQVFAYTDVPPEVAEVVVEDNLLGDNGSYTTSSVLAFAGAASGSATLAVPGSGSGVTAAFGTALVPGTSTSVADEQVLVSWGPVPGTPIAIDVGSLRLRSWVTQPELNPVAEQLTWSVDNAGIVPDYVVAALTDSRTTTTGTTTWDWLIAGGGNEDGAINYPTLPTDIFDFNFHDTDSVTVDTVAGAQTAGGYDAARANVFDNLDLIVSNPTGFAAPNTTGTAAVQFLHHAVSAPATYRAPRHAYRARRRP